MVTWNRWMRHEWEVECDLLRTAQENRLEEEKQRQRIEAEHENQISSGKQEKR